MSWANSQVNTNLFPTLGQYSHDLRPSLHLRLLPCDKLSFPFCQASLPIIPATFLLSHANCLFQTDKPLHISNSPSPKVRNPVCLKSLLLFCDLLWPSLASSMFFIILVSSHEYLIFFLILQFVRLLQSNLMWDEMWLRSCLKHQWGWASASNRLIL